MAYWCVVHEEQKLKLLTHTAPFEAFNRPEDKAAWLAQHKEVIREEYKRTTGRDPVRSLLQTRYNSLFINCPPNPI